jgi:hypothetical protein
LLEKSPLPSNKNLRLNTSALFSVSLRVYLLC